jgi:hypothetical protein
MIGGTSMGHDRKKDSGAKSSRLRKILILNLFFDFSVLSLAASQMIFGARGKRPRDTQGDEVMTKT